MLLHSDQGSQYSSAGYVSLLKQYNVIQSMSRAGTPRDNAVIESVFGWFKDFLRVEYLRGSSENIVSLLAKAVHEFKFFHPSHKLNYLSPVQFRLQHL
jgi:Transposase and inactivated derivatives